MAYTSFGASRSSVNNAGVYLRDYWRTLLVEDADKFNRSLDIAWRYRAEFQTPLTKVVMGMRSFITTEGVPVVVAQRLKRLPTILDKLTRHPTMKLTYMQDIGGCRAIIPGFDRDAYADSVKRSSRRDRAGRAPFRWRAPSIWLVVRTPYRRPLMARRAMSEVAREAAAHQAAIRTIAAGERPVYRVLPAPDGRWEVLGCPWLSIDRKSVV